MKYYCIGIKGTGMSTLAQILYDLGNEVSGYDDARGHKFTQDGLEKRGIPIYYDHDHELDKDTIVTYSVAFTFKNSDKKANELEKEISAMGGRVLAIKCDMSDVLQIKAMVEKVISVFGKIDVLVNNAGICLPKLLIDTTDEDVFNLINTNLNSVIFTSREVVREMIKFQSGSIINISSCWGVNGASMETVYSASKAGIIGFTQGLSKEVGRMGIRVNAIAPGLIMTDMNKGYSKAEIDEILEGVSLARVGEPEDIADVCLFLASDKASYITGQCLSVDGGLE